MQRLAPEHLFPRSAERGSIEAIKARIGGNLRWLFPRSAERGSIEANLDLSLLADLPEFPRSAERGSIEAKLRAILRSAISCFHVRLSVAPLKLVSADHDAVHDRVSTFG